MSRGHTNYSEMEQYSIDGWANTSYSVIGYTYYERIPAVFDAEGTKNPLSSSSIAHAATVVSRVNNYRYSSDEPLVDRKRCEQLGSAYDRPEEVEYFLSRVHNQVTFPAPSKQPGFTAPKMQNRELHPSSETIDSNDALKKYKGAKLPSSYEPFERYGQLGSANDRPEKVESFLNKGQNQVNNPNGTKVSAPLSSNWRVHPNSIGKDCIGTTKYGDDSNLIRTNPLINNKDMDNDRPRGNEGPGAPRNPLSKPTKDIGSAEEFRAEAIKPSYGINTRTHVTRPIEAGPLLSSIPWRKPSNMAAQDSKMDSGEDDGEKPKEQSMYGRDKIANHREPTNPINNKESYEKIKYGAKVPW